MSVGSSFIKSGHVPQKPKQLSWHHSFSLISKSSPETVCATILLVEISEVAAFQLNLGSVYCEFCLLIVMVV